MNLSFRLKTVASFVKIGNRLADIGTDHGYIPIYLVSEGVIPEAIAMDVNKGPLERAKNNIIEAKLENKIQTRLSDGLEKLEVDEADTILIAGMGGILITDILARNINVAKSSKELILSPHSDIYLVRKFLCDENFLITDETMIIDDNKFYVIIKAEYSKDLKILYYEEVELSFGKILLENKNSILHQYLLREEEKKIRIIKDLKMDDAVSLISSLEIIRKGLKYYENS